ncbi:hypothetical protein [Geitlerinema sp. P-1104]|nr:hypothetical protein [Geitlerinema sp. P-1104]
MTFAEVGTVGSGCDRAQAGVTVSAANGILGLGAIMSVCDGGH